MCLLMESLQEVYILQLQKQSLHLVITFDMIFSVNCCFPCVPSIVILLRDGVAIDQVVYEM